MTVTEGRYPPRDRIWLGVNSIQLTTTAEPVDLHALRERVIDLARQEPQLRYFTRPGSWPDRYRRAADGSTAVAMAEGLVQELPAAPGPGSPLEAAVGAALDADDGTPMPAVYAGHGLVGHRFPHVLGDGLSAVTHLRRLVTGPEPKTRAPFPIPGLDRPLAHALSGRYLSGGWRRAGGRVLADLRMPRFAPPPGDPGDPGGPGDAGDPANPGGAPGENPPLETIPVTVQIVIRQIDAAAMQVIKDWRKANASGISTVAVQMAAIRRGLAESGLSPATDGMYVAFDLRPHLRAAGTGGNFISVPYLQPSDPLDPISVNTAIKEAAAAGLPLVVLARGAARAALKRHPAVPPMRRPSSRRDVSFSHMRVGGLLSPRLITGPDRTPMVVAAAMPPGEGSLSFMLTECGPQTTVTAVFCSPFTAREPVERVLDRLAQDPLSLLGG